MSSEKFTPGEWEIEEKEMGCGTLFRYGFQVVCWEKRRRIAYMETCSLGDKEEMQANAALIAAAPEMYKVLSRECVICEMKNPGVICDFCRIGEVLKKARGEND